nr:hypothetical protein [Tanacetum cinerariifolium]
MVSPGGSIVASLKNVNGFLAVNTPSDDLIHTDFEQEGVVPKVMLHILKEFVLLLGRHSLNNDVPRVDRTVSLEKSNKECHRSLNNNILPVEVGLVIVIGLMGYSGL